MRLPFTKSIKPAVILYSVKTIAMIIIFSPLLIYFNSIFGYSRLTDNLWPLPSNLALVEVLWHLKDLAYVMIPLVMIIGLLYFILIQFLLGRIYFCSLDFNISNEWNFINSCTNYFKGFLKIAIAAIPVYILIFSLADIISYFVKFLVSAVLGEGAGKIARYLVIFLILYLFTGYLVCMRHIQVVNNNSSLRFALVEAYGKIMKHFKYFLAINVFTGLFALLIVAILIYILTLLFSMNYYPIVVLLALIVQQLTVFLWSYFEAFQINLSARLIKE